VSRREVTGEAWCTTPVLHGSVIDVLAARGEHDIEGIVAKRVNSPYRPGERSSDWLKLKIRSGGRCTPTADTTIELGAGG
jgi:bifunctional non-homologous end joining protein LigD